MAGTEGEGEPQRDRASSGADSARATQIRTGLYRKEAIAHQRERAWGELVVATPRAARWLAWCSVLLAIAFVAFLLTAQYTRKARAPAMLAYANDPVLVAATDRAACRSTVVCRNRCSELPGSSPRRGR